MIPKTYADFEKSLPLSVVPEHWPLALQALWFDAKGNWEASHNIAQAMQNTMGSWLHAYLHRKEGDRYNASYWYGQAGRSYPDISLQEELKVLVKFVLKNEQFID